MKNSNKETKYESGRKKKQHENELFCRFLFNVLFHYTEYNNINLR